MAKKTVIGRKDKVDFPDFGLFNVPAKVDTGAYTSSIHCSYAEVEVLNKKKVLTIILLDPKHSLYTGKKYVFTEFKKKKIRVANGESEIRYIIKTHLQMFGKVYPTEVSLAKRREMKFPVLIGRKALAGKFIVDPGKYDLSFKHKKITQNPLTYLP